MIINALNGHHPNFIEKERTEKAAEGEEDIGPILAPKLVKDRFFPGVYGSSCFGCQLGCESQVRAGVPATDVRTLVPA